MSRLLAIRMTSTQKVIIGAIIFVLPVPGSMPVGAALAYKGYKELRLTKRSKTRRINRKGR